MPQHACLRFERSATCRRVQGTYPAPRSAMPPGFAASRMIDKRGTLDMSLSLKTARRAARGAFIGSLVVILGACSPGGSSAPGGSATASSSPSPSQSRTVNVGVNPQNTVLDQATHTLYALSDPENNTDGSVSVLNASTCNALRVSGCVSTTPSVQVGNGPVAIAVDQATDTIYVVNSNRQ